MSMKKWTKEELISTRDNLEAWSSRDQKSGSKMWHFTAFLGAFAVSTGIAFIFFDGVDVLNVLLIVMGSLTCLAWYKSEKRRKDNQTFLSEINKELKQREKKTTKSKAKPDDSENNKKECGSDQNKTIEESAVKMNPQVMDSGVEKETKN
ncbi:hypothetical protein [Nitrosomonas aestuarii]|uniref:hypothetical protein n=1 Tax=Nitrosomonas aestuarii TaxID=52441 RepID=UPI000D3FDB03|nr:hypothetical protein [Nitrosomonas aestuarii]PTN12989.1 hypothetical protein C8R11_102270 [Nitrosomonas aestuarii]